MVNVPARQKIVVARGSSWQKKQEYWVGNIIERFAEIVEADEIADSIEEISQLRQWLLVDHFDLENINSRLKQYLQAI